jgi:uncharacterized protein YggL (DUF469 family)
MSINFSQLSVLKDFDEWLKNAFRKQPTIQPNTNSSQSDNLTISFLENIDLDALGHVITVVAQDNNVNLQMVGFKVKDGGKELEIFVDVFGESDKAKLLREMSQAYDTETQKRKDDGTVNYVFIETLIQNNQNNLHGSDGQIHSGTLNMSTNSENYSNNFQGANIGNVANTVQDHAQQQASYSVNLSSQRQTLAEAAAEIQRLLKQLEETNPTVTDAEQIAYVNIATKSDIKQRAIAALKEGGETAIEEFFLENKYLKVGKAVIKGWLQGNT